MNKRILVAVAIGETYEHQADVMAESFLAHNAEWDAKIYRGNEINSLLPMQFRNHKPFNRSEIGRWCAVRKALEDGYETAFYCDNDVFFYGGYEPLGRGLVLFPHYVTDEAQHAAAHWLIKDGIPNLGMFEANGQDGRDICDVLIREVDANPQAFMHANATLWLQNVATYLPYIGYDVRYNTSASHNVAHWNLKHKDRIVISASGWPNDMAVNIHGAFFPLLSFHFSAKGINTLERYGTVVERLRDEYLKKLSSH